MAANLNPESEYKPNPAVSKNLINRVQGSAKSAIGAEHYKVRQNTPADGEFVFLCNTGKCSCTGACPLDLKAIKTVTLASNAQIVNNMVVARLLLRFLQEPTTAKPTTSPAKPAASAKKPPKGKLSPNDNFTSYMFSIMATGGKRYAYTQAN